MIVRTYYKKLEEAEYFHNQILEHYKENSDVCGYYLNAFITSCRSSLDYVIQSFLASLKVYDMDTGDFKSQDKRQKKFKEHLLFGLIETFASDYYSKMRQLKEDPEMKYFLDKRNMFIHQKEDNIKSYSYTQQLGSSDKIVNNRRLEGGLDYHLHPEKFTELEHSDEIFRMAPHFKKLYPNSSEFECAIRELDMKPFLKSFLNKCRKLCQEFDEYRTVN